MQKIQIKIDTDGEMTISVNGVKGRSCKDMTREIEKLGQLVISKETREFHERETDVDLVKNGGGK